MILNIIQEVADEDVDTLAMALWYELEKEVETTKKMTVVEATEKGYKMTILEDTTMCIAVIKTEMLVNSQAPKDFIEEFYTNMTKDHWKNAVLELLKKELLEKRAAEDKAMEEMVDTKIQ